MKRKNIVVIFSLLLAFPAFTCGQRLPVAEMTKARGAITTAESVQAAKYAPQELTDARAKLLESHDSVMNEKWDEAKDKAVEAETLAVKAYEKALPLLAKDGIDTADKSIDDAEEAYAEKFAPTEYGKAQEYFNSAQTKFENKDFYQAYKQSIEADKEAKNARSVALGKKSVLKESMEEVNHVLKEAEKYNVKEYAPVKYNQAKENLSVAEAAYQKQELKKSYDAMVSAKLSADEAYVVAAEETAKNRLAVAEVAIEKAEKSKKSAAKEDIAAAKESQSRAKNSLGLCKYSESIAQSDEAIRLATIAGGIDEADINAGLYKTGDENTVNDEEDSGEYVIYKVKYFKDKAKDCLWRISQQFYGNPRLWRKIFEVNKETIQDPDKIFPGWRIKIPKKN